MTSSVRKLRGEKEKQKENGPAFESIRLTASKLTAFSLDDFSLRVLAKRLNRTRYILVDIQKIVSYEQARGILKLARLSRRRNTFSVARLNISTHNGKKSILRDKSPSNFSRYSLALSGIRSIFTGRELSWLPFVRGNNHFLKGRSRALRFPE